MEYPEFNIDRDNNTASCTGRDIKDGDGSEAVKFSDGYSRNGNLGIVSFWLCNECLNYSRCPVWKNGDDDGGRGGRDRGPRITPPLRPGEAAIAEQAAEWLAGGDHHETGVALAPRVLESV
jgi:hypothetical protein